MLNVRKCLALATLALCCLPFSLGLAAPKRIGLLPVKNFTGYTGKVDFGSIIEGEIASRLQPASRARRMPSFQVEWPQPTLVAHSSSV